MTHTQRVGIVGAGMGGIAAAGLLAEPVGKFGRGKVDLVTPGAVSVAVESSGVSATPESRTSASGDSP